VCIRKQENSKGQICQGGSGPYPDAGYGSLTGTFLSKGTFVGIFSLHEELISSFYVNSLRDKQTNKQTNRETNAGV